VADTHSKPVGPLDATKVPRFAGLVTFARLPRREEVESCDIAIVGMPFDSGTTFRPGARFGPEAIRAGSRLLRTYNPALEVSPFEACQVADAGDIAISPFDIEAAMAAIESGLGQVLDNATRAVALGGDHTIALPILRVLHRRHGPIAVVHFDAHLDTWDTYFGAPFTHGTPFRRASEEGLLSKGNCIHLGIRGPIYERLDLSNDSELGFVVRSASTMGEAHHEEILEQVHARVGDRPVYVSVDIDVLDPGFAPGTGTPEPGGLSSRELLSLLRGLRDLPIVGADVVEVAPAYDHAQITALAAAHVAYELVSVMAIQASASGGMSRP
jgi:agmatinase